MNIRLIKRQFSLGSGHFCKVVPWFFGIEDFRERKEDVSPFLVVQSPDLPWYVYNCLCMIFLIVFSCQFRCVSNPRDQGRHLRSWWHSHCPSVGLCENAVTSGHTSSTWYLRGHWSIWWGEKGGIFEAYWYCGGGRARLVGIDARMRMSVDDGPDRLELQPTAVDLLQHLEQNNVHQFSITFVSC